MQKKGKVMKDVMILINSNEFQGKILDFINSEELDKCINSSVYSLNKDAKGAIIYGMTLASMQTCRCQQYLVSVKELETPLEGTNPQLVISGDKCIVCGRDVKKDDVYYDVNGGTICKSCMDFRCKCKN